jgi:hypothetical protein
MAPAADLHVFSSSGRAFIRAEGSAATSIPATFSWWDSQSGKGWNFDYDRRFAGAEGLRLWSFFNGSWRNILAILENGIITLGAYGWRSMPGLRVIIAANSTGPALQINQDGDGPYLRVGNNILTITNSGNIGIGTTAPNSRLHVAGSISVAITRRTTDYTLTAADCIVICDASSGAFTISLPSAAGIAGRQYTIKKVDSSPNAVTIVPHGTETIDGASSYVLSAQWKYVTIVSDGSNWLIIANN